MTDKWPTDAMIEAGREALMADRLAYQTLQFDRLVQAIYLAMEAARPSIAPHTIAMLERAIATGERYLAKEYLRAFPG